MKQHDTASDYFGSIADSYDSLIHRAVPRYDEMISRLFEYLPPHPGAILELGAGTGNLTCQLADRYPDATIVSVDASKEMLDTTRQRLGENVSHVRLIQSRFEELDLAPASFDLVCSCISLHHVLDKASLFRAIRAWLRPGGRLGLADQCRGATDEIHAVNWRRWIDFCDSPGHCAADETKDLLDHAEAHDHYIPVREHFSLFEAAGFDPNSIDCVWRNWIWAILIADAPTEAAFEGSVG